MKLHASLLLALLTAAAHAGPRTSANYSIATDTADAGGRRTTSAAYTNDGSVGGIAGISTVAAPAETAKHGYIGQLYDVSGLVLSATPTTVKEGGTLPLNAAQLLDDATTLAVPASSVAWSVAAGPLEGIDASGLAKAQIVYQDTSATARGAFGGFTALLNLTVRNVNLDDFGSYAGDGLDDDWQVQYFGQGNPQALATVDADHDGLDNRFEFLAGLIPTDPASVFKLRLERSVQGTHVIFSPIVSGRTYTVIYRQNVFSPSPWLPLPPGATTFQNGDERTVIDANTQAAAQRFYRVEISR